MKVFVPVSPNKSNNIISPSKLHILTLFSDRDKKSDKIGVFGSKNLNQIFFGFNKSS